MLKRMAKGIVGVVEELGGFVRQLKEDTINECFEVIDSNIINSPPAQATYASTQQLSVHRKK